MRILRVQLTNVKSYTDVEVRFAHGTNCICGENGAGKTTIVEAIGWALFNSLPYSQERFRRDGTTAAQVSVLFLARDGREYEVIRNAGGRAPHWYVFDPEISARLAEGAADVREWLHRALGTEDSAAPSVLFENAVGVPQGGLTAPFLQSAEKRKDAFDPILRVNEYADAAESLRETNRHLENRVRDEQACAATHAVEADKIPQITEAMNAAHEQIVLDAKKLEERREQKKREDEHVAALEIAERRIMDLRHTVNALRQTIERVSEQHKQASASVEQAWRAQENVARSARGHRLHTDARDRLVELRPRHEEYRRLTTEAERRAQELERTAADLESVGQNIAEAEAVALRLPELEARASEATNLGKRTHALEGITIELPRMEAELNTLREQLRQGEREVRETEDALRRIADLRPVAERAQALQDRMQETREQGLLAKHATEQARKLVDAATALKGQIDMVKTKVRDLKAQSSVQPEIERLAGSVEELAQRERTAQSRHQEVQTERAVLVAQKDAQRVACPLSRADCLAIQQERTADGWFAREMSRVDETSSVAAREHAVAVAALAEAQAAVRTVSLVQGARVALMGEEQRLVDLRSRHAELNVDLADQQRLAARHKVLQDEYRALKQEFDTADAALRDVGRQTDLEAALRRQIESNCERVKAIARQQEEIARRQGQAEELAGMQARLREIADAPIEHASALALANTVPALAARREALTATQEQIERTLKELARDLKPLEGVEAQRQEAEQTLEEHRQAYDAYLGNIQLSEELPARQVQQKQVEAELTRQRTELERQDEILARAQEQWDDAALRDARARVGALSGEIGALTRAIEHETARLNELRADLAEAERQDGLRQAALREATRLGQQREVLAHARSTIKAAQGPVTEALLYGVSQEARNIFSEIIEDGAARLSWTPDYEVLLERGSERLVFQQMSGGEQMSAALAVRLALLKTLSEIDLAFLDEPTQNMDETRRTNLAAQVREVRGFDQLFVISHDDTFERQVNHAIVVRKHNGESSVEYPADGHREG